MDFKGFKDFKEFINHVNSMDSMNGEEFEDIMKEAEKETKERWKEREAIRKIHTVFLKELHETLFGEMKTPTLELLMDIAEKAKRNEELSDNQKKIIDGFFEVYVAMWLEMGEKDTNKFTAYILTDEKKDIMNKRYGSQEE